MPRTTSVADVTPDSGVTDDNQLQHHTRLTLVPWPTTPGSTNTTGESAGSGVAFRSNLSMWRGGKASHQVAQPKERGARENGVFSSSFLFFGVVIATT